MIWLVKQFLLVRRALCARDSARQMAFAVACGLLLGLLPKGNLLAVTVGMLVLATRISLPICMLVTLAASLISPWLDPVTGRIGHWLLTHPALAGGWTRVDRLPFAAWTAFNNTVVLGNLVTGLALFYPVYRLSLPWMARYRRFVLVRTSDASTGKATSDAGVSATPETSTAAARTNVPRTEAAPISARSPSASSDSAAGPSETDELRTDPPTSGVAWGPIANRRTERNVTLESLARDRRDEQGRKCA